MRTSAEHKVITFLRENYAWYSSGDLQRKEWLNKDGTKATPRSIVRRLEENTYNEQTNPHGILEVDYGNKGAAVYRIKQEHRKLKQVVHIEEINGQKIAKITYEPISALF